MLLALLACTTTSPPDEGQPAPANPGRVEGPGYHLTVPDGVTEILRHGLRVELADRDGSPTVRVDEPARLPLAPEAVLEDAVQVEQPDPLTVVAVGTDRGDTVVAVLKAAAEDGPWIQATCAGRPADAELLRQTCTSLTLTAPAPAARHALPGLPLSIEAPHPPQPDGPLRWLFAPPGHELYALQLDCQRLDGPPSEPRLLATVTPHGDPTPVRIDGGLVVLTEDTGGLTDAVAELGDSGGTWQCRCSSVDHIWRQRQALGMCLSLQAK